MKKLFSFYLVFGFMINGYSQYHAMEHRKVTGSEIAISVPGTYAQNGATYVLTNDLTSNTSTVFLGKNVVLDLNGYTIKYADAGYEHIINGGFELGDKGWDLSKAPGAKVVNTKDVHVFLGEKLMSLKAGDEILSSYINLPVANRSYFAMCGITGHYYHSMKKYPDDEMRVSIYVEDENGNEVKCLNKYGDGEKQGCPVENKSPRLGGGFIYAHLTNLPTGKYRIRVKAETDCLVDEIDIRPAMDVGISIIGKTSPLAHYDHLIMESYPPVFPAFYDYTEDMVTGKPLATLPQIEGTGTITIKNGTIAGGTSGIQSWGIQSSANDVKVVLDNVRIVSSGISAGTADILYAEIRNCKFDADMPFLIQRHVNLCSVVVRGDRASEVSNSEFNGGEGCLSIKGKYSLVHDNIFRNNQTVTNHYCIMGSGDSSRIFNNRFEPVQGSGIYVSRYTEVANNVFKIETSSPTCEYGREEYSTAAIRLGDYGAEPGSPKASVGNRIHDNKIMITAKNFPEPQEYIPMAWGVFYSASGGENYVYDNEITVHKIEPASKVITAGFYICGGPKYFGGQFYGNKITTNVPAAWVASMYGGTSNTKIIHNTIVPLDSTEFKTFRIGSLGCDNCVAKNVEFRSNDVIGRSFDLDVTDQNHSFSVFWTCSIIISDKKGIPIGNEPVTITDNSGKVIIHNKTDKNGNLHVELPEYSYLDGKKTLNSPYRIQVKNISTKVFLNQNAKIPFVVK